MLYLVTGGNGTGKTLNTLKWCREQQVKEGRPVAYNGRFDVIADGELKDWKKIDAKDWQAEPDGTIFFFDECHNDFPKRGSSAAVPDYVKMLGEHRKRGFDFYLITQHPSNIDAFVRKIIASPGWHRHLKRPFGQDLVSVLEFSAVNEKCEQPSSGKNATVTMVPFPKEVYKWYTSASLHTGKKKIPKQVWMLGAVALLVPAMVYVAYSKLMGRVDPAAAVAASSPAKSSSSPTLADAPGAALPAHPTREQWLDARVPRIAGLPQTAPIYDAVTAPVDAPYPAACISSATRCTCYTQQTTRLPMDDALCRELAANGYFRDWRTGKEQQAREDSRIARSSAGQAEPVYRGDVQRTAPSRAL